MMLSIYLLQVVIDESSSSCSKSMKTGLVINLKKRNGFAIKGGELMLNLWKPVLGWEQIV